MPEEVEKLLRRYRELAAVHFGVDYAVPSSVRAGNAAGREMRAIAARIGEAGEAAVKEFGALLAETQDDISLYAAFHLIELTSPTDSLSRGAFRVIEERAAGDGPLALGCRMRLEELRKR